MFDYIVKHLSCEGFFILTGRTTYITASHSLDKDTSLNATITRHGHYARIKFDFDYFGDHSDDDPNAILEKAGVKLNNRLHSMLVKDGADKILESTSGRLKRYGEIVRRYRKGLWGL